MKELKSKLKTKEIRNLSAIKGGDDDGGIRKRRVKKPKKQ